MKKSLPLYQLLTLFSVTCNSGWAQEPATPADDQVERPPLVLAEGEQRILNIKGLLRYSLGGPAIRAQPLPAGLLPPAEARQRLLIKGVQPGSSDLWVWKEHGQSEHRMIRVEKTAPRLIRPELESALQSLRQTEVVFTAGGVVLRGTVDEPGELQRISALVLGFPREVLDETETADGLLDTGQARLEEWIRKAGETERLRIVRRDGALWAEGSAGHPDELERIGRALRARFPAVHLRIETLPDASPTVHFKVFLLELKRSRYGALGLAWPAAQEGAFRVTSAGIQDLLQLDLTLQALEGEGSVKILSNPELAVRAPGEAELFSGGELPIQSSGKFYSNTSWKNYGLSLKLKVTHSTAERVRLEIETEVSFLDPTVSPERTPGLQANRMRTQVDARFGTPLLLSGLLKENTRSQVKGLPFLRGLPVLGALFGSQDYMTEKSELVAILVPSATPPPAPTETVRRLLPRGPMPPPRHWLGFEEERRLRESPDWPWNALR